jgi:hypothetical protein
MPPRFVPNDGILLIDSDGEEHPSGMDSQSGDYESDDSSSSGSSSGSDTSGSSENEDSGLGQIDGNVDTTSSDDSHSSSESDTSEDSSGDNGAQQSSSGSNSIANDDDDNQEEEDEIEEDEEEMEEEQLDHDHGEEQEEMPLSITNSMAKMVRITRSPYSHTKSAEVGEQCFEELKGLMIPIIFENGMKGMNPEMKFVFGDKLSLSVYAAHHEIGRSGKCFVPGWTDGKMLRGIKRGWLPNRQLLLCLHDNRFGDAEDTTLRQITKNLNCYKIVDEAMGEWDLEEEFLRLSSCMTYTYERDKSDCYKCEIFVARAFATLQILKKLDAVDESLMKKVKACLSIMNKNVRVNAGRLAKWKEELKEEKRKNMTGRKITCLESASEQVPNQRPVKEISVTMNTESDEASTASGVTTDIAGDGADNNINNARKMKTAQEREESLMMLYSMVKEQHNRLGEAIALLRDSIDEHRRLLRDEYREELRREMMHDLEGEGKTAEVRSSGKKRRRGAK